MFGLMQGVGLGEIDQVRVSGGGAKSMLWRQILADVLGVELVTLNTTEGAAYGAALLAGVAAGAWPDVDTASEETVKVTECISPDVAQVEHYSRVYEQYRLLYPALKEISHSLSALE
jgi:xylulokinase